MSMSQPRKRGMIKLHCPAGRLVTRPAMPTGPIPPKWMKFYNWPRDKKGSPLPDAPGFPRPEDIPEMIIEVPADQHHTRTLIYNGHCTLVDDAPVLAPTPKPKKDDK